MKKIHHLVTQIEFHLSLAVLSLVVVSWPILSTPEHQQPEKMVVYLFFPWAILILVLLLISHSSTRWLLGCIVQPGRSMAVSGVLRMPACSTPRSTNVRDFVLSNIHNA